MFKRASDLRPAREVGQAPAYLLVILYRKDVMIPQAITNTWPWYVAGPIIGLFVPILLLMVDKRLGIFGNQRHLCSALLPQRIEFLRYDWRGEGSWNLIFVLGIAIVRADHLSRILEEAQAMVNDTLAAVRDWSDKS